MSENTNKVIGKITVIQDVESGESKTSGKAWAKVVFVIETEGEYPKTVAFTVFGAEKVDKFLQFKKVGQRVEVSFDIQSREYKGKYYTDANAWNTWNLDEELQNSAPVEVADEEDDLPF